VVFRETPVAGAWVVDPEPSVDERGSFARVFDAELFAAHGLSPGVVQCSVSLNTRSGTLRGLHYQADPHAESKLVRCTAGSVYDVVLDLRPHSSSYLRWHAVELTSENRRSLYVPAGTAHGFQTLVDGAELTYMMDAPFVAAAARGVRWDDPAFAIEWPSPSAERTISERDRSYPDYRAS
jgi:dTDP-4-dehydrorhamnose 3,5-epimerase